MPSTSSTPDWPRWSQWLVVSLSLVLSVVYGLAPQRPLAAVWQGSLAWAGGLLAGPAGAAQLTANPDLATEARPLAAFGLVGFTGCDLATDAGQVWLITNWQLPVSRPDWTVQLRLVQPNGGQQATLQQALDAATLRTRLPEWYFSGGQRGRAWLSLVAPASGQPVPATLPALPLSADGWLRICG